MKAVITGVSSLRNRGLDALVATTIEQLAHHLPEPSFLVLDQAPDYDAYHLHRPDTRVRFDETLRPWRSWRAFISHAGRHGGPMARASKATRFPPIEIGRRR